MNVYMGECFGSFGEMLQGFLPGGKKFLINMKITNRSRVSVSLNSPEYSKEKEDNYIESYRKYSKTYKILRNILIDIGRHDDLYIEVESNIPVGKGLSSSTADMVAGVNALQKKLSISLKKDYISRMLTEIEPNDGIHYEGTSAYHHATGKIIRNFEYVPPINIVGIDMGGELDTVKFNAQALQPEEQDMRTWAELLEKAMAAYEAEDLPTICDVATQSARLWQGINPKPYLEEVLRFVERTEALGVINTHSGTYLGLAYGADRKDVLAIIAALKKEFPDKTIQLFQSISC